MKLHSQALILAGLVGGFLASSAVLAQGEGSIVVWGDNSIGQCNVPLPNTGFIAVAAGANHILGLKSDGSVVAWGGNWCGQCSVPAPNSGFVAIAACGLTVFDEWFFAYYGQSVALKSDGSIDAWGGNPGDPPAPNAGFISVAAGYVHSLGLKTDGAIVAWGDNRYGQCNVPTPNADFIAIAAGPYHSLGVKADGSVVAWGTNWFGECNVPSPNTGFTAVAAGGEYDGFSLGLKTDGSIVAWGRSCFGEGTVPPPNMGFTAVAAGRSHVLGLKDDGSIVAWGANVLGECTVPLPNAGFTAVAAGGDFSVGIRGRSPQAVWLVQFLAVRRVEHALVHWVLARPREHAGFFLWRQELGRDRVRLSQALLSGQTAYDFTDPAPPAGPADYWLQEITTDGSSNWYGPAHLEAAAVPSALHLHPAAPNPFNPRTTIRFDLPVAGQARLSIYDLAGRLVRVLVEGEIPAGSHEAVWDGRDSTGRSAPSGSYLARLVAGGKVEVVRMGLVR